MKQLFASHTSGWIVLVALLASSSHLAGCDTSAPSKRDTVKTVVTLPSESKTTSTPTDKAAAVDEEAARPTTAKAASTAEPADPKDSAAHEPKGAEKPVEGAPLVKRLIIASDVKEREPIELTDAKIENPIVAFVELKNPAEQDTDVVVTFEHAGGTKVGFVELTIPAKSPRYRTWARTRNIKTPGEWSAVVTSKSGEELARTTFQVAG